jgi:hypothetical protein
MPRLSNGSWQCPCKIVVECQDDAECSKLCAEKCSGGVSYTANIETSIGVLRDSYPPSVKKLWDVIVFNQPPDYNYNLAASNQVDYTNIGQGLVHDHVFPSTEWGDR